MRHRKKTVRLQRQDGHRRSLLANQACALIQHGRIRTTMAKAKAVRPVVEKLITLAKEDTVHRRRMAFRMLRQKSAVQRLFAVVAPAVGDRPGGYCRVTKLGPRTSDAALMAYLEWVDLENLVTDDEPVEEEAAAE
ncbi:50S ribosomal protein L17 [bacterium]|nr:50S ribosomal protein L17 [Akkermansiaceae bacterium]MDA7933258.1 50S ribosomal protein L17 [bacterium]MDA7649167.1 50S ribosomal protein L17 [Akkermansiaceae bacterium]MDA7672399.1 50S ribosomal protein L17 [Akkermansiaceae bacterium]MDA7674926.1 50S ribosomal protein L17 [Akkermansiaceae bacterium]